MEWRNRMLRWCGPGVLAGITFGQWARLLRQERNAIEWSFLPRLNSITVQAFKNTLFGRLERKRFGSRVESVILQPPLFVLGHWRSGTTLLHNLLAQDPRFAWPNSYQTSFPQSFLFTERLESRLLARAIPRTRPMDDMEISMSCPQEDEFALCAATLKSPCMAWVFPAQREKFEKYLTMRDVNAEDLRIWGEAFLLFLRKLQWLYRRPLVLKSPPHTARVRLLLELFPRARFVHIHRNPYAVFLSSRRAFQIIFGWHGLQRPSHGDFDDWLLRQYSQMYDAFLEDRTLIPKGRFCEVAFEALERDPPGEMRRIYRELDLEEFGGVEATLREYVSTLQGYRKNALPELANDVRLRIASEWRSSFKEWGYPV